MPIHVQQQRNAVVHGRHLVPAVGIVGKDMRQAGCTAAIADTGHNPFAAASRRRVQPKVFIQITAQVNDTIAVVAGINFYPGRNRPHVGRYSWHMRYTQVIVAAIKIKRPTDRWCQFDYSVGDRIATESLQLAGDDAIGIDKTHCPAFGPTAKLVEAVDAVLIELARLHVEVDKLRNISTHLCEEGPVAKDDIALLGF